MDEPSSLKPARRFLDLANMGQGGWRYPVVASLALLAFLFLSLIAGIVLVIATGGSPDLSLVPPNLMIVAATLPFVGILVMLWLGVRFLHRRPFRTIITPLARLRWGRMLVCGLTWFLLSAAGDLVLATLVQPGTYIFQLDAARLLPYAALTLLLIPMQSTTEELLFRGYLMQAFGRLSRGAIVLPWVVTSVFFGLLHGLNTEIATYGFGIMMVYYIGLGLLLGWLTLSTGSLEPAIGLHVANNLYSTLMVTFPGSSLPAPAVFRISEYDPVLGLVIAVISGALILAVCYGLGYTRPVLGEEGSGVRDQGPAEA